MRRVLIVALLVAAPLMSAEAQERGFYVGADLGQSMFGVDQAELDDALIATFEDLGLEVLDGQSNLRDEDLTYSLTLGYRAFSFLAVEAAWMDLGSSRYKASAVVTDGVEVAEISAKIDAGAKGPAVSVLGILPFADVWSVYARVGAMYADVSSSVSAESGGLAESLSDSNSSTEMLYGVGRGLRSKAGPSPGRAPPRPIGLR